MQNVKSELEEAHLRMSLTNCPFNVGTPYANSKMGSECRGKQCAAFGIVAITTVSAKAGTPKSAVTHCGRQVDNGAEATNPTFEVPTYGCLMMRRPSTYTTLAA